MESSLHNVIGWCPKHSGQSFLDCYYCKRERSLVEPTLEDLQAAAEFIFNRPVVENKRFTVLMSYCKTAGKAVRRDGIFSGGVCSDETCKGCHMISEAIKKEIEK